MAVRTRCPFEAASTRARSNALAEEKSWRVSDNDEPSVRAINMMPTQSLCRKTDAVAKGLTRGSPTLQLLLQKGTQSVKVRLLFRGQDAEGLPGSLVLHPVRHPQMEVVGIGLQGEGDLEDVRELLFSHP